jgi:ATP-dependent Lon protease
MNDLKITALKYEVDFYTVDVSRYVGGESYNGLTFVNYGTSVVKIENITLQPNQQFEVSGNVGEITSQRFFVNFGSSTTGNNVVVVRKRYLNVK